MVSPFTFAELANFSGTIETGDVSVVRGRYGELSMATLSYSYSVDGQYYGGCDSKGFQND